MFVRVNTKPKTLQELVLLGLLVAINIVLQKISFGPATVKVGLGFIGNIMLGYYFGPFWGGVGGMLTDLLTSALFGFEGGFFPGFTLSAIGSVVIYGFFLYQKPIKLWRITIATILVTIIVNIMMNTYWLHILYGMNLKAAFMQRIFKELIIPWIQIIIGYVVLKALQRVKIRK